MYMYSLADFKTAFSYRFVFFNIRSLLHSHVKISDVIYMCKASCFIECCSALRYSQMIMRIWQKSARMVLASSSLQTDYDWIE